MKLFLQTLQNYGLLKTLGFALKELKYIFVNRMLYGSYSQNFEDLQIAKFLGKKNIFYVDVGCHEPVRLNNTFMFYKNGSTGINIDANPQVISNFKKVRPNDVCVNFGVGESATQMEFNIFSAPALSTFDSNATCDYQKNGHKIITKINVEVLPLTQILQNCNCQQNIDLLTVDVEGMDLQVFKSLDFSKYKPKLICAEKTNNNYKDTIVFLQSLNYNLVWENNINAIFLNS